MILTNVGCFACYAAGFSGDRSSPGTSEPDRIDSSVQWIHRFTLSPCRIAEEWKMRRVRTLTPGRTVPSGVKAQTDFKRFFFLKASSADEAGRARSVQLDLKRCEGVRHEIGSFEAPLSL